MAKEEKARVKMTVIHFETESDNETLKENIRSIAQTLSKALSANNKIISTTHQISAPQPEELTEVEDDFSTTDFETEPQSKEKQKKRTTFRQYRTPQTIDIDLNSGELTFKDFVEQKKPDNENKKFLVTAYWLKRYRNISDISADHVYTCFRYMGWQVPADVTRAYRNMKGKKYGWINSGSIKGTFTINHLGENVIEKM